MVLVLFAIKSGGRIMKKIILVMMCLVMTLTAGCIGKNAGTNSAEEIVESVLVQIPSPRTLFLKTQSLCDK